MFIPVINVEYAASAVDLRKARDECPRCRAERQASVLVCATGQGSAADVAAERALDAMPDVERILMELAACPCCRRRNVDTEKARRFKHALDAAKYALSGAFSAFVFMVLVEVVALKSGVPIPLLVVVAALLGVAIVVLAVRRASARDRRLADLRVEWLRYRSSGVTKWKKLKATGPQSIEN